jgi:hypothetical protein
MNHLQKAEINWIKAMKADRDKPLQQKFLCLKLESHAKAGKVSPKRAQSKGSPLSSEHSSRKCSPARESPPEVVGERAHVAKKESRTQALVNLVLGNQSQKKAEEAHEVMGNKWPKTMWDNTENYWRMIMAEEQFVITPANYNRQQEVEFRQRPVIVEFAQLMSAREKCLTWMNQNEEYFTG